jgi:hypothetical protein
MYVPKSEILLVPSILAKGYSTGVAMKRKQIIVLDLKIGLDC